MGYCEFLTALFEDGRVIVPEVLPLVDEEVSAGDEVIAAYERVYRLEMPSTAPQFIVAAGRWAGTRLFRACQFAVYRDVDEKTLSQELGIPYDEPLTPDVHYSVDLVFQYLPDVTRFASSAAEHDPLLEHLCRWARRWPLSSVGMSGIGEVKVDAVAENASLMRVYADRIIATGDGTRLSHCGARQAVREALGMFPDLAPEIAAALAEHDVQDTTQ